MFPYKLFILPKAPSRIVLKIVKMLKKIWDRPLLPLNKNAKTPDNAYMQVNFLLINTCEM